MSKRAIVTTIAGALFITLVIWMYGQHLPDDVAIQRFIASATAIAAVGGLLAFIALAVYTVETSKLRQVAQQQVAVAQTTRESRTARADSRPGAGTGRGRRTRQR